MDVFRIKFYKTKVGESADGGDNYGISNQLRLSSIPKGKIHCYNSL
jgi:hypothetical protein